MQLNDKITKAVAESVKEVIAEKKKNETEVQPADKDFVDLHTIDKKKRRGSEPLTEKDIEEANDFTVAAAKAAVAGKKEFEFEGEKYPVEIALDVAKQIVGKSESVEESVEEPVEESTAEYAKSLEKIANDRKMKNISKKDKETLVKIADLLKRANEAIGEKEFKPHMMYDPETGKAYKAEKPEDHERMSKLGYVHDKPEIDEAIDPRKFALGGNTKATKRDVDAILSKIFMNDKLAKQVEGSEAYKAGFKSKGKGKNPYKKDTADFHLYILGQQSASAA